MRCTVLGQRHVINPANVVDMFQMITLGDQKPLVGIREVGRERPVEVSGLLSDIEEEWINAYNWEYI